MYNSAVFAEVNLFALKFYLDRVAPPTILGVRNLARDTGLHDGEDRIRLRSLVLTRYRRVMDRRI